MTEDERAFRAELPRLMAAWAIPCEPAQQDALVAYAKLLLTWNERINLTGATSLAGLATEHLPDSFALASRLEPGTARSAVGVGSGGGLPGLPLAILAPMLTLRLVEPIAKKAAFLRTAVRELDLGPRLTVEGKRAESLAPATFDLALSRATLAPPLWAAMGAGLVVPGGRVFVLAATGAASFAAPVEIHETGRWVYFDGRRTLVELTRVDSPVGPAP